MTVPHSPLWSALDKFCDSNEFADAVVQSTQASFDGSGYSVELFKDETYRILWDGHIGNAYVSSGVIISIPAYPQEVIEAMDDSAYDVSVDLDEIQQIMMDRLHETLTQA